MWKEVDFYPIGHVYRVISFGHPPSHPLVVCNLDLGQLSSNLKATFLNRKADQL